MSSNLRQYLVLKKSDSPSSVPPSPKRSYLVSRSPVDSDFSTGSDIVPYSLGDNSPQCPVRSPDGSYVARSILGDSQSYLSIDSEHQQNEKWTNESSSSSPILRSSLAAKQRSRMQLGTSTASIAEEESENEEMHNPESNPEAYLLLLRSRQAKAMAVADAEKSASLTSHSQSSHRTRDTFDGKRDKNILGRWSEQQAVWASLEKQISTTLRATPDHVLLMSSVDEFRAKTEEYDALQLARPIPERFGASTWQMDLRNGGSRMIPTGSLFSGLESNIKFVLRDNPVVRKPIKSRSLKTGDVTVAPSKAILETRMKLRESLRAIRPHIVSLTDADDLVVRSEDLYEWALRSSKARFSSLTPSVVSASDESVATTASREPQAKEKLLIAFHSLCDVVLFCKRGQSATHVATFTNQGSIALSYTWKISSAVGVPQSADSDGLVTETIFDRDQEDYPRAHLLCRHRPSFFCLNQEGVVLPGETVRTEFKFLWKEHGGVVAQTWVLDTVPSVRVVVEQSEARLQMMGASMPPAFTPLAVTVRGISDSVDETSYLRRQVTEVLDKRAVQSFVELEIYRCIRRVRNPVRAPDLSRRIHGLFVRMNETLLRPLQPIFLSAQRIDRFFDVYDKLISFTASMNKAYREKAALVESRYETEIDDVVLQNGSTAASIAANRRELFPEDTIDIFDEIIEEDISLRWDMDLSTVLKQVDEVTTAVAALIQMECVLDERKKEAERLEAAEATIFARNAAREERRRLRRVEDGSDFEESDDEEEEEAEAAVEEPDEDGEVAARPRHALEIQIESIRNEICGGLNMLMLRELDDYSDLFTSQIQSACEVFSDSHDTAVTSSKIPPTTFFIVSTVDNGGMLFWDRLEEAERNELVAAAAAKDNKKKAAVPGSSKKQQELSQEQIDSVFSGMKKIVQNGIFESAINSLCEVDVAMETRAMEEYNQSGYCSLPLSAVLRQTEFEDGDDSFQGRVAFVTIDESLFTSMSSSTAFTWTKVAQFKMLSSIRSVVQMGIRAVVILFESRTINGTFEEIGENLSVCLGEYLNMDFSLVHGFCQLSIKLADLADVPDFTTAPCPVFFMKNLNDSDVVPAVRPVVLDDSIESEIIPIGLDEYTQQVEEANRVKRMMTRVSGRDVLCSPIPAEALSDAYSFCREKYGALWIDGSHKLLFDKASVMANSNIEDGRFLSSDVRETAVWASVLLRMPYIHQCLSHAADSERSIEDILFCDHVRTLFKDTGTPLVFAVIIGGEMRPDKIKLLGRLIDIATTVIVAGEVAIPFMSALYSTTFTRHKSICDKFHQPCLAIIKKARMRGVKLLIPSDALTGDAEISSNDRSKVMEIDPSSRDDGIDYEGDTSIVKADCGEIHGYVYDLGPDTINQVTECITRSHIVLQWGSAGACELSSFQSGQRAVVEAMAAKEADIIENAAQSLVVGYATVEWFSRFADSDGERTNGDGDIVKAGIVAYSQRCAAITELLCLHESYVFERVTKRLAEGSEWYHREPAFASEDHDDDD